MSPAESRRGGAPRLAAPLRSVRWLRLERAASAYEPAPSFLSRRRVGAPRAVSPHPMGHTAGIAAIPVDRADPEVRS
jgi:hypothetical protein